jgi:small-conductance mechanosensitive channel
MMKKIFPLGLALLGLVFLVAGGYTAYRGFDAQDMVRRELVAQKIVTPEDASIPNAVVDDPATAESMADIIDHHSLTATGGKTYSELDRTDPTRTTAFQASALRTSLYTSVMAFNIGDLVIGLGAMIAVLGVAFIGLGIALEGLVLPSLARRVHVQPIAA